jgi:hypothetical protein
VDVDVVGDVVVNLATSSTTPTLTTTPRST